MADELTKKIIDHPFEKIGAYSELLEKMSDTMSQLEDNIAFLTEWVRAKIDMAAEERAKFNAEDIGDNLEAHWTISDIRDVLKEMREHNVIFDNMITNAIGKCDTLLEL